MDLRVNEIFSIFPRERCVEAINVVLNTEERGGYYEQSVPDYRRVHVHGVKSQSDKDMLNTNISIWFVTC